jgi:DNA invertase Pin-like site-specific DNA recombinase
LAYVRAGDTVVVWKLDRLGRNMLHILQTVKELTNRGVTLVSVTDGIDSSTSAGRMIAGVLTSLVELELVLGRERRAAAKAARKVRGLPVGRPRKLTPNQLALAERMRASGEPVPMIAQTLNISTPSMYRLLAERSKASA